MYSIGWLAELLGQLDAIQQDTAFEAEMEGDNSKLPKRLKTAVKDLAAILRDMVKEETNELTSKSETADNANESSNDIKKLELSMDEQAIAKFDSIEKSLEILRSDLAKFEDIQKQINGLVDMQKRIEALEQQPMPTKIVTKVVAKGEDYSPEITDIDKAESTQDMIKMVHQQGGKYMF
jgi:DNA repair exonuclease SbcCD ATPase subunit